MITPEIDAQLRMDRLARRDETCRFDLLDKDLHRIDVLTADSDNPPTVTFDTGRQILRTLSGLNLPATDLTVVDTLTTRIRPVAILESGAEFNLGVFMFGDASRALHTAYRPGGGTQIATQRMESELVDQSYILDQHMWRSLSFAIGATLSSAIDTVLDIAGVVVADVEATPTQIREPISWVIGQTTWLEVLKELHLMAGFTPPYFDNDGVYIGRTERTLALGQTPDFSYDMVDSDAGRIYIDTVIESDDLVQSPNRYMVIDNASTQAPIVGTYDVPADAPHSITNRGFVIPQVTTMQGLASQQAADSAAAAEAAQDRYSYRWVEFDAHPDYRHDGFNIVAFNDELYREQSWRINLMERSGRVSMHHSLRREYIAEDEFGS